MRRSKPLLNPPLLLDLPEFLSHPSLPDVGRSTEDSLLIAQIEVSWGFQFGRDSLEQ